MPYAWETKPSAEARRTGYRTDSRRHQIARAKVPKHRRVAIARLGGQAMQARKRTPGARNGHLLIRKEQRMNTQEIQSALGLSEEWDVEAITFHPTHLNCGPLYGLIPDGPGAFLHCFGCGQDFPYPEATTPELAEET